MDERGRIDIDDNDNLALLLLQSYDARKISLKGTYSFGISSGCKKIEFAHLSFRSH